MPGVPDPRPDGRCCVCVTEVAVTIDGRLCGGCLRDWLDGSTRRNWGPRIREQLDRSQLPAVYAANKAEENSDGDEW